MPFLSNLRHLGKYSRSEVETLPVTVDAKRPQSVTTTCNIRKKNRIRNTIISGAPYTRSYTACGGATVEHISEPFFTPSASLDYSVFWNQLS